MKKLDTSFGAMDIIYEDGDIVVVNKPHGLHCIEDRHKEQDETLRSLLDEEYGKIYIVHRLDAGTGGIMIAAKNPRAHAFLCRQFEYNTVGKEYLAVAGGDFGGAVSVMLPIAPKIAHGKYKINFKSGKRAVTQFIPIHTTKQASLVRAIPVTGRSHQIRVHLKAHKHPLIVDWVYNKAGDDRRLPLFAHKIRFTHPNGRLMELEAPLSAYMAELCAEYGLEPRRIP